MNISKISRFLKRRYEDIRLGKTGPLSAEEVALLCKALDISVSPGQDVSAILNQLSNFQPSEGPKVPL